MSQGRSKSSSRPRTMIQGKMKPQLGSVHRYSRGTFQPHPDYIRYMNDTVKHIAYAGMPNAVGESGRVNWQVSSGKSTSFYKYYLARSKWWERKADELGLPGTGNSDERFSIAARLIHPTNFRPCRLCGEQFNVGYFYLNKYLEKRWRKRFKGLELSHGEDIRSACRKIEKMFGRDALIQELTELFPERGFSQSFKAGVEEAFLNSIHIRTFHLSPGFMCNPPDRLDGFHDYANPCSCRKKKDPGRSDENLRSYLVDRRSFEWWAEGNWKVAASLYNAAGEGACCVCGKTEKKITPDHVGPLACGFKQIPLFRPMCRSHNSSKNRRFTLSDVQHLMEYEKRTGESCASWQVRAFWDGVKCRLKIESDVKLVGSIMRGIQDYYLRFLHETWKNGGAHFISYFLQPEFAHLDVEFEKLDPSTFRFDSFKVIERRTSGRTSLEARAVRIAFESLVEYVSKGVNSRKFAKFDPQAFAAEKNKILKQAALISTPSTAEWQTALGNSQDSDQKELAIGRLLGGSYRNQKKHFAELKVAVMRHFDIIGRHLSDSLKLSR